MQVVEWCCSSSVTRSLVLLHSYNVYVTGRFLVHYINTGSLPKVTNAHVWQ